MRIKTIFLVLMLGWIIVAVLAAQANRNYSPLDSGDQTLTATQPQVEPIGTTKDKVYTVPRKQVLIEGFTSTTLPYCPLSAVAEDQLKSEMGDSIAVVNYHIFYPGHTDPFYTADATGRTSYYGVWGIPTVIFNGTKWDIGGYIHNYEEYRDSVNQQLSVNTPGVLTLDIQYDSTLRTGKVYAMFNSVDQIVESNLHLRYAITESHMHYHWGGMYPGAPILDSLQFIERDMLPSDTGVAFTINQGDTYVDSQSFFIDPCWVENNCNVIVWVQSDVSTYLKKVLISNEISLPESPGGNLQPNHVLIDSVRVWKHESGSYRVKLSNDLDSIDVNDRIRFYGRVMNQCDDGMPFITVIAFNAFGYNGAKSQGLDTVITDASGNFIFPNSAEDSIGLLCEYADLYPFWFAANDSVAIPIIIEALDRTTTLEAITDTLIALYRPIFEKISPNDSVMIGIPDTTDPLVVKFNYYPPDPLNLVDTFNNHFMEGFAYNYHGPSNFHFLYDSTFVDTMAWLTRGAWLNNSRTKGVVDTLKNYLLGRPIIRVLAIRDEYGQWHNVVSQNLVMRGWLDNLWNSISYGIEAGICAGSIIGTLGIGAAAGCLPIAVHIASDLTKTITVPFVCDEVIKAEDPEQCRSVGGAITDVAAGLANIWLAGGLDEMITGTETHLGWWNNPRNLAGGGLDGRFRAGAELYADLVDWEGVGETVFNTEELQSHYYQHPNLFQNQSYGIDGLTFKPQNTSHMLYGTDVGRYITMVDAPTQNHDVVFSSPTDPPWLIVTVQANKPFYQDGTTNLVPPTIIIENGGGSVVVDPSNVHLDADNSRYWAWIPTQDLPGWTPGLPWFGKVRTTGSDIVSNLGVGSSSFEGAQYSSSSDLTLTLEDGSNAYIPQNALETSLYISFGPSQQLGGEKSQDTAMYHTRFLGSEYKVAPTNLQFNVPIRVSLKLDTLAYGNLGDSLLCLAQFDSLSLEWKMIGTEIDSANSLIKGFTLKAGRFRVALTLTYLHGDANGDRLIDVGDVVYLINYLYKNGSAPNPLQAGDATCDSVVDVGDVVYLINYLFKSGPAPSCK